MCPFGPLIAQKRLEVAYMQSMSACVRLGAFCRRVIARGLQPAGTTRRKSFILNCLDDSDGPGPVVMFMAVLNWQPPCVMVFPSTDVTALPRRLWSKHGIGLVRFWGQGCHCAGIHGTRPEDSEPYRCGAGRDAAISSKPEGLRQSPCDALQAGGHCGAGLLPMAPSARSDTALRQGGDATSPT